MSKQIINTTDTHKQKVINKNCIINEKKIKTIQTILSLTSQIDTIINIIAALLNCKLKNHFNDLLEFLL